MSVRIQSRHLAVAGFFYCECYCRFEGGALGCELLCRAQLKRTAIAEGAKAKPRNHRAVVEFHCARLVNIVPRCCGTAETLRSALLDSNAVHCETVADAIAFPLASNEVLGVSKAEAPLPHQISHSIECAAGARDDRVSEGHQNGHDMRGVEN